MKLENKIAVITGANGVIGSAIARAYIDAGASVVLLGRSRDALEKTRATLAGTVSVVVADVTSPQDIERFFSSLPRLDILVTAAGVYGEINSLEKCEPDKWLDAVKTNLFGTMLCVKYALPLLRQSPRGKVITFAGGGDGPLPNFSSYASSKGAVVRFTESVAAEVPELGINAISPGLVNSGFVEDIISAGPARAGEQKYREALEQTSGTAETFSPERAAALAVFLGSDASNGLTGKNISAIWDKWEDIPEHLEDVMRSDVYNWRRIKPKDRGYGW